MLNNAFKNGLCCPLPRRQGAIWRGDWRVHDHNLHNLTTSSLVINTTWFTWTAVSFASGFKSIFVGSYDAGLWWAGCVQSKKAEE
jgi:hypothetical protein